MKGSSFVTSCSDILFYTYFISAPLPHHALFRLQRKEGNEEEEQTFPNPLLVLLTPPKIPWNNPSHNLPHKGFYLPVGAHEI